MEIEISDKKRKLNHIGFIVSGWMYQRAYAQIVQLYKELVENGTIEPIEHINRIEDADVEFLIFKFFIAFDKKDCRFLIMKIIYYHDCIL